MLRIPYKLYRIGSLPLSRQAPQPEQTTQPPAANEAPNPPSPSRAAAPTPSRGYLFASKCPRPDPLTTAQHSRSRQRAGPRSRRPRRSALSLLLLFEKASPTQPCGYEALEIKELSHRLGGVFWPRVPGGAAESADAPRSRLPAPPGGAELSVSSEAPTGGASGSGGDHSDCGCFWGRCTGSAWRP